MAYSIPDCFMIAFAAGLIFAVVYEILRIIRVMFPFHVVTFVCDIVFFVIAAGAVTKLSLSLGNYIRIYTVLGFGAGIFTYITTLGRLLNIVENAVALGAPVPAWLTKMLDAAKDAVDKLGEEND